MKKVFFQVFFLFFKDSNFKDNTFSTFYPNEELK